MIESFSLLSNIYEMRSDSQSCKYPWLLRGKQAALFHFIGSPGAEGIVSGRTKETRAGS